MNLFANNNDMLDNNPSTGVLDSVMIAYDDLRIVNSKLIELEYEKEINKKLKQVVINDSILYNNCYNNTVTINKNIKKVTKQRNVCFIVAAITTLISIICIIK